MIKISLLIKSKFHLNRFTDFKSFVFSLFNQLELKFKYTKYALKVFIINHFNILSYKFNISRISKPSIKLNWNYSCDYKLDLIE